MKWIEIEFSLGQKTKLDNIISGESLADFLFGCFITRKVKEDFWLGKVHRSYGIFPNIKQGNLNAMRSYSDNRILILVLG